jgi:hypothetical protein
MADTTTTEVDAIPPSLDALYAAHPHLDPLLLERDRYARRSFTRWFRDPMRNDWHYSRLLNRLLHPLGEEHPVEVNERIVASYLRDADSYVNELADMIPAQARPRFALDEKVASAHGLRQLASLFFEPQGGSDVERRRRRYEVQRKLYLAKLLLHVDNTRLVQDGPRHRRYLLEMLDKELWSFVTQTREEVAEYQTAADEPNEAWRFDVKRIQRAEAGSAYDLEVYHFDSRFKKETAGFDYTPGRQDYRVAERPRFGHMERARSGSILSKMLRKGINDPTAITDMLGMKFIVRRERDVYELADLLHQVLVGPFAFRNQVDLFRRPGDRDLMNRFSAPEFKAFKEDLDLLFPAQASGRARPYFFAVELQIMTVDSFMRTVHSRDFVSHFHYRRRQFLQGVLPCVFPALMYGEATLDDGRH